MKECALYCTKEETNILVRAKKFKCFGHEFSRRDLKWHLFIFCYRFERMSEQRVDEVMFVGVPPKPDALQGYLVPL